MYTAVVKQSVKIHGPTRSQDLLCLFSLTLDPMGVQIATGYSSQSSYGSLVELLWKLTMGTLKVICYIFEIFDFNKKYWNFLYFLIGNHMKRDFSEIPLILQLWFSFNQTVVNFTCDSPHKITSWNFLSLILKKLKLMANAMGKLKTQLKEYHTYC